MLKILIAILAWLPLQSKACEILEEGVFYEQQARAFEVHDLEIVVAQGGQSKVYFSKLPYDVKLASGRVLAAGESALIKVPLTPTEASFLSNEFRHIRNLKHLESADLFVDAALDSTGVLIMPYNKSRLRTLEQWLEPPAKNPPPPLTREMIQSIQLQLNEARTALQQENIVHSDLKPANVLVEIAESGGVKIQIIDFGIAAANGSYPLRGQSERGGTPEYASESQLSNKPARFSDDSIAIDKMVQHLQSLLQK